MIRTEARFYIVLYALIIIGSFATGSTALLYVWLIPLLLGQPFLRLYLLAEHAGCEHDTSMFINTRTIFTNRIVRFVAWNMPYHAEHHAFPSVPFHQLPALHVLTKEHLLETSDGYTAFHQDYQSKLS